MLVETERQFEEVINALRLAPTKAVDVETNGLDAFGNNQLCGVGVATGTESDESYYFPFRHQQGTNLPYACLATLMAELSNFTVDLIGYNIKFDLRFLENDGLVIDRISNLIDVIVMVRLTEPSTVNDLGLTPTITRHYGTEAASYDLNTKKVLKSNKWNKDFSMAPSTLLGPYCELDVSWTYQIYNDCYKKIQKSGQLEIFGLECKLTRVLYDMECRGVAVDKGYALESLEKVEKRRLEVAQEIYDLAGHEFSIQSPQQVGEVFNSLGISSPIKTPGGKESWSEMALIGINHKLAGLIRQYRALGKLQSTYIEPYTDTDILHTQYCNWGALTGMLCSRSRNLQNIPRNHFKLTYKDLSEEERFEVKNRIASTMSAKGLTRIGELDDAVLDTWGFMGDKSFNENDEYQIAIRRTFVPREGFSLVAFDYSQMEVRVFLSYLNNDSVNEMLKQDDVDFHAEAAKLAFKVTEESADFAEKRQLAKNITFGTIYGIGTKRLALQLQTSQPDAALYKKKYFEGLQGSKEFFDSVMTTVADRGWIKNRYGRVYKIPVDYSYKGVNYLVQGTAADILNERIIKVHEYLSDKKSSILMQVHDEIICEIHDDELAKLPWALKEILEDNSLGIPLAVDMEVCDPSWATKRDYWKYTTEVIDHPHSEEIEITVEDILSVLEPIEDYIDWS